MQIYTKNISQTERVNIATSKTECLMWHFNWKIYILHRPILKVKVKAKAMHISIANIWQRVTLQLPTCSKSHASFPLADLRLTLYV